MCLLGVYINNNYKIYKDDFESKTNQIKETEHGKKVSFRRIRRKCRLI